MTLPGETLATGAAEVCADCGIRFVIKVLRSAAGYYLGTECQCGPWTRESGYYDTAAQAQEALDQGDYFRY